MIYRKNLLRRKIYRSDVFLTDSELRLFNLLKSKTWFNHSRIKITKKEMLNFSVTWEKEIILLEYKGRVQNITWGKTFLGMNVCEKITTTKNVYEFTEEHVPEIQWVEP